MWKRFDTWACRHEILIFILCGVVLLRIPSLFEPYWYGDEGIYLTIGQALNRGQELYRDIHDNKPPLLYWTAALAGGNQFWFKVLAIVANVLAAGVFWKIAHRLTSQPWPRVLATIAFGLLTTLPIFEGTIANAENFFILPTLLGFWTALTQQKSVGLFLAGLMFGIAGLFKVPALLEVAVWPIFWLGTDKRWFSKSFWLGIGAVLPLVLVGIYYWQAGTLHSFLIAAGLQNVPYLSSWQAVSGPMGTLTGRAALTAGLVGIIFVLRRRLGNSGFLISVWWVMALFAALLSGRPYPHYFLQMAGAMAMGVVLIWGKTMNRASLVALLVLWTGSYATFGFWGYSVPGYYQNFLAWVSQTKSIADYRGYFNKAVNRNYALAETIMANSTPEDTVFVWGDEPMIYALSQRNPCGRYTAQYHIVDFGAQSETVACLRTKLPRYIVTFPSSIALPGAESILEEHYWLEQTVDDATLWRRFTSN